MMSFLRKYSTPLLLSLLVVLLTLAWLFPSRGLVLGIIFLSFSFLIASLAILEKHRQAYRTGKLSRWIFIRNATLEITATWAAMLAAGLLGRVLAHLAAQHIAHELVRLAAGIAVGICVGISVGALLQRTLGRFLRA